MKTRASSIRMAAAAVVALAASTGACGGGGQNTPPTCLQVQPCGGDVVGTWSFLGACTNVAALSQELSTDCPGASINAFGIAFTGTVTFNADSTYTATNWHESFAATETVPLSCADGASSCAEGNESSSDTTPGGMVSITTTCSGTSTCTCRVNGTITVSSDTGSWTTTGSALSMNGASTATTLSYCVQENQLHMMSADAASAVVLSDIVAVRQ